jgi:hypothetical protein
LTRHYYGSLEGKALAVPFDLAGRRIFVAGRRRARASRNAVRHGLSLPVGSDPALCEQVEALREIAGTDASAELQELARRVAEAQIDLVRVRYARRQLMSHGLSNPNYDSRDHERKNVAVLGTLLRGKAPDMLMEAVAEYLTLTPEGPQKFAILLSQEAKQLLAMDRYERRARKSQSRPLMCLW